ncbi:uncharacterized protein V1518DRAFT_416173 [Limtongia smithiae]|uniref:uncharacterized protein n=1 Tax=Limtongia smithiae TaxID=1125753 RepID=UPI0034CF39FD
MSLESALEEERLEILKLLQKDNPPDDTLELPNPPSRVSRSASPMRASHGLRSSRSQPPADAPSKKVPYKGGKITASALVKNFNNLSPAAQELLLSSATNPALIGASDRSRRDSSSMSKASSMILPSAGPDLKPYPGIGGSNSPSSMIFPTSARQRSLSTGASDGGEELRRYKSADDSVMSLPYMPSAASASSPSLSPMLSPLSPTTSRSKSPSTSRSSANSMDFSNAYRRLSDAAMLKAGGKIAELASKRSTSSDARLAMDEDEDAIASSSSSDSDDDDSGSDSDLTAQVHKRKETARAGKRAPQSLLASMEEERKAVAATRWHPVESLIAPPPPSHIDGVRENYRRHLIHPKTAFDLVDDANKSFISPYTSDTEEAIDIKKAVNLPVKVSDIETNAESGRVLRTITRGDYESISKDPKIQKRSYIVATDSSPESMYALEWTIGTILRDGNVMYAVQAIEEIEESKDKDSATSAEDLEAAREQERLAAVKDITANVLKLLRKTRLQVECVIEVMHCKSPKHLICDVIDYLTPTMVILGSRGRSALKGVLLGSFSNYLVTKSSVPVMVARKKLKKSKHHNGVQVAKFSNNLREGVSNLTSARVD